MDKEWDCCREANMGGGILIVSGCLRVTKGAGAGYVNIKEYIIMTTLFVGLYLYMTRECD